MMGALCPLVYFDKIVTIWPLLRDSGPSKAGAMNIEAINVEARDQTQAPFPFTLYSNHHLIVGFS
jgi:hypothetical protein